MNIPDQLKHMSLFPLYQLSKVPQIPWREWEGDVLSDSHATGYGIDCGRSGIVVVDVDMHGKTDGVSSWVEIQGEYDIPDTLTVATAGGGFHYYFQDATGEVKNSASKIAPGIDVRGDGGCIVGPGSRVKAGSTTNEYEVLLDIPIAPLPLALKALITAPKHKKRAKAATPTEGPVVEKSPVVIPPESLTKASMELFSAPEGTRNAKLNEVAYKLTKEGADIDFLTQRIAPLAASIGLTKREITKTLESAHSAAITPEEKKKEDDSILTGSTGYYADAVMSTRFGKLLRQENWAYVNGESRWCRYNDSTGLWEDATAEDLLGRTKAWCFSEVKAAMATREKEKISASVRCLSTRTISNIAHLVRLECKIQPKQFTPEPHLIACENGVLDLKQGKLLPHSPSFYNTKHVPLPYDPTVKSKYLDEILDALPEDSIEWFISMAGQSLTGEKPSSDRMIFMNGVGANGKSTVFNLLSATAGDYGGYPSSNSLVRQRGNSDEYNLMMYQGLHQAIVEEMPDKQLDTVRMKLLTGTDAITARKLYKDQVTFTLRCTVWVSCNILPQVTDYDHGTWRRIVLIPFSKVYKRTPEEVTQPHHRLGDDSVRKAAKEDRDTLTEFFSRRAQAAMEWYRRGGFDMEPPPSVVEATNEWRAKGDNIRTWFNETIVRNANTESSFVLLEDMRDSYNRWLMDHGYSAISHKSFIDRLSNHDVFTHSGLEITRGRVARFTHSTWSDPTRQRDISYTPRKPADVPTHIKHIAFSKE